MTVPHPSAAFGAPDEPFVVHMMAEGLPGLALREICPFITIEGIIRVVGTVGRLAASAGTKLSLAPSFDGCFPRRIGFTLPVFLLPVFDPDVWLAGAMVRSCGDHFYISLHQPRPPQRGHSVVDPEL